MALTVLGSEVLKFGTHSTISFKASTPWIVSRLLYITRIRKLKASTPAFSSQAYEILCWPAPRQRVLRGAFKYGFGFAKSLQTV
jgi:hypothetical protein